MVASEETREWSEIGEVESARLVNPRLQLHWALQTAMAFADAVLERLPDDSQSNFEWREDFEALVGRRRPDGLAAGLRIPDMTLLVFSNSGAVSEGVSLEGRTLGEVTAWLEERVAVLTGGRADNPIRIRDYEMPPHPLAEGAPFEMDDAPAYAELGTWFANGNLVLNGLEPIGDGWAEVRCWPHHFDLGTLTGIEEPSKSIGAGFSPGDNWCPEPYFYVNLYGLGGPPGDLPSLESGGDWHTEGWFGALLTATSIIGAGAESQHTAVQSFLRSAIGAAEDLLAEPSA